ncbi:hypothetical protein [Chitinimonas sp. JJ19]|uniref:hypothetical protein n=1 Tax=Chitinimonas sp. JJ19 TaxID=3109352 RepID=UPI003002C926
MKPTRRSFDIFDTLITRRHVMPQWVQHELERRTGLVGLADARRQADFQLYQAGQPYGLDDIWYATAQQLGLDDRTRQHCQQLEIQLEQEELIPIQANLQQVQDGDLLVSDMYLSVPIIEALLTQAGLRRKVGMVISNDGKHRGHIWPALLAECTIASHLGDHPHSDVASPQSAGIPSQHYTGAKLTQTEQWLSDQGHASLARWLREARLANPYSDHPGRPALAHLWLLATQFNLPLLYSASLALEAYCRQHAITDLLFISRDAWLWQKLHQALFPQRRCHYFLSSRACLLKPSASYIQYAQTMLHPHALLVDLAGTGTSWQQFLAEQQLTAQLFLLQQVDNYQYLQHAPPTSDRLALHALSRASEIGPPYSNALEQLNFAQHARVQDVVQTPDGQWQAQLVDTLEYPEVYAQTAAQGFAAGLAALPHYPELTDPVANQASDLIPTLLRAINADRGLAGLYQNQRQHDARYIASLQA